MAATFTHPTLGQVQGNQRDGVAQFLGLRYASIRDRFAPPELVDSYGSGDIDATKFGSVECNSPLCSRCLTSLGLLQYRQPAPSMLSSASSSTLYHRHRYLHIQILNALTSTLLYPRAKMALSTRMQSYQCTYSSTEAVSQSGAAGIHSMTQLLL